MMKFKTDPEVDINMTHKVGELHATYAQIVDKFGIPVVLVGDDKVQVEWRIEFDDGMVANIHEETTEAMLPTRSPTERICQLRTSNCLCS